MGTGNRIKNQAGHFLFIATCVFAPIGRIQRLQKGYFQSQLRYVGVRGEMMWNREALSWGKSSAASFAEGISKGLCTFFGHLSL